MICTLWVVVIDYKKVWKFTFEDFLVAIGTKNAVLNHLKVFIFVYFLNEN